MPSATVAGARRMDLPDLMYLPKSTDKVLPRPARAGQKCQPRRKLPVWLVVEDVAAILYSRRTSMPCCS